MEEVAVLFWYKVLVDFFENEIVYEVVGDKNSKPEPLGRRNPFVLEGSEGKGTPTSDPNHFKDWEKHYHMKNVDKPRNVGEVFTDGLSLKTKTQGKYPIKITFKTPEGFGEAVLNLEVV